MLILPPLGYLDFLILMKNCKLIITDSGGIQEEATAPSIRKPVLVMRLSTERPEAVEAGFAKVVGTDGKNILSAMEEAVKNKVELPSCFAFRRWHGSPKNCRCIKEKFCLRYVSCFFVFFFTCFFSLQCSFFFNLLQTSHHCFCPRNFLIQPCQVQVEVESGFQNFQNTFRRKRIR